MVKVAPTTPRTIREVQLALDLSHSCPNHFSKIIAVYSNTIPYPPTAAGSAEQPKPGRPPKYSTSPVAPMTPCLFVVMDKPAGTLEQVVAGDRNGRLDEGYARVVFAQIVGGVAFLHGKNLAHCNLKPSNVSVHKAFMINRLPIIASQSVLPYTVSLSYAYSAILLFARQLTAADTAGGGLPHLPPVRLLLDHRAGASSAQQQCRP